MSPRKLLIEAWMVALLAAPAAPAEEAQPPAGDETMAALEIPDEEAADSEPASDPTSAPESDATPPDPGAEVADAADAAAPPAATDPAVDDGAATGTDPMPAEAAAPGAVETDMAAGDEAAAGDAPAERPAGTSAPAEDTPPALGAVGYDSQGREGRIHIVVRGDTLWDVSDAYLGTPWVWPSIWQDNGEIENPHLIHPGDRIWITDSEMRRVSAEEAARLLSNGPPEPEAPAADYAEEPPPAAAEDLPPAIEEPISRGTYLVSSRETAGLITAEQLDAAASIVDQVPERVFLSQEDEVFIGLGESQVQKGDQLTIFRTHEKVFDPDTGQLLGYHVDFLGWVEVIETHPEASLAEIAMSTGEVRQGDRLLPREPLPAEIPIQASPAGVEGKITFFPQNRVLMGYKDFVYLNRGTLDGLEVGSPLEVYRPARTALEVARDESVQVPDHVVAEMLVVRTDEQSAVALVTHTARELKMGDRFRGATR